MSCKSLWIRAISSHQLGVGQPQTITGADYSIEYTYTAGGGKLSMKEYNANSILTKTTDYCGQFVYQDNKLAYIHTQSGRILVEENQHHHRHHIHHHLHTRHLLAGICLLHIDFCADYHGSGH